MPVLSKVVPLVIFFVVLTVAAFVGYAVYTIATDVADKTSKKMEKKNISFGKDGMKIGIKELRNENYVDQTQRYAETDGIMEISAVLTCVFAFSACSSRPGITRNGRRISPGSGIRTRSHHRRCNRSHRESTQSRR